MRKNNLTTTLFIVLAFGLDFTICLAQSYETTNPALKVKPDFNWPDDKVMALSLTFDDARLTQIDKGIPLLDKYCVKATFYLSPGNMAKRLDAWRKAVLNGHEVGNHSL